LETLTIHAAGAESAREMLAALSGFQAELMAAADGDAVVIALGRGDGEVVAVLNAIQHYVNERADGPARVDFAGHSYVMHREPEPDGL
jgi:hypothetical protein